MDLLPVVEFTAKRVREVVTAVRGLADRSLPPEVGFLVAKEAEEEVAEPVVLSAEFDTPSGLAAALRHHGVRVEFKANETDDFGGWGDSHSLADDVARFHRNPHTVAALEDADKRIDDAVALKLPQPAQTPAVEGNGPGADIPLSAPGASPPEEVDWKALLKTGRVMPMPDQESGTVIPPTVTRVVVVHGSYPEQSVTEKWAQEWDVHVQDDGRTLKLFAKNATGPRYEHTPGFFDPPPTMTRVCSCTHNMLHHVDGTGKCALRTCGCAVFAPKSQSQE